MWTEPTRYTAPWPRVAFHANARLCASGSVDSVPTAAAATIAAATRRRTSGLKSRLEVIKAPLDAMCKSRIEVDAVAEIANQVRHRESAGVLQHALDGERARRIRKRRLAAAKLPERSPQRRERHRLRLMDAALGPREAVRLERRGDAFVQPRRNRRLRQRVDERVREFVREHAIELPLVHERAAHRRADGAVVRAGRP